MTLEELKLQPEEVRRLYLIHLQQMYSAEEQLLAGVPAIAIGIATPQVRQLLLEEAVNTPDHLDLLKTIFAELQETPTGPSCKSVKALVDLGMELSFQQPFGLGRDLLMTAVAIEMKHLNIAKYTVAATFAHALHLPKQEAALSNVIKEESSTERRLRFFIQNFRVGSDASLDPQQETEATVVPHLPLP